MPEPTIDTALWRATSVWSRHDRSVIIAEVRRLRSLLARCVDHRPLTTATTPSGCSSSARRPAVGDGPIDLDALQARARMLEGGTVPARHQADGRSHDRGARGELARCSLKSDATHDGYRDGTWEAQAFEEAGDLGLVLAAHCEE